ncbi:MAG TPA: flagellar filament capping protein FliD [Nocardioidaceae bacterium]|nr:flagellar filament capping protein FliD [Nocardioidaceae bacterium]
MAATSSVSGLVSGLDTASIISQLMQVEAQPQNLLKSQVTQAQNKVNSLQTVNSKFANIATKAGELADLSNWKPSSATSDNDDVTVSADAGATVGSLSFTVNQLATAAHATYRQQGTLGAAVTTADVDYTITFNDPDHDPSTVTFNTGDGSLGAIADALNASGTGVHATLVRVGTDAGTGDPTYSLEVTSAATGADSGFSITETTPADPANPVPFLGGAAQGTAGTDASITVDGQTSPLTSSSNTFTDLMPGVDVTIGGAAKNGDTATVSITRDAGSLADKVSTLVDAVNAALKDIDSLTAYDPSTETGGILTGDSTLRSLRNQLLSTVTAGVGGTSLASVGIEVDKDGQVTFDSAKFTEAYRADPAGTAAKFAGTASFSGTGTVTLNGESWRTRPGAYAVDATAGTLGGAPATVNGNILLGAKGTDVEGLSIAASAGAVGTLTYRQGFAASLEALTQHASDPTIGSISAEITGQNSSIDRMNDKIADWDVRLAAKQDSLKKQFTAMEVALGTMQNQASWLSGQISSLPGFGTGS